MAQKVLITGVTGQDGSFLAELLLLKGYEVFGLKRRTSVVNTGRLSHIIKDIRLLDGDLCDSSSMIEAVKVSKPSEVYNLASQSFVKSSFTQPEATGEMTGLGTTRLLEAVRRFAPEARFYQASSSEMFGSAPPPQDEDTRFHPRSPYGAAKLYAHWMTINYREAHGLFGCCGILYNHETIAGFMPVIFKDERDLIDIKPISEVVRYHTGLVVDESKKEYQEGPVVARLYIWDQGGWTKVKFASGYPHQGDKNPRIINAREGCFMATDTHIAIMEEGREKRVKDIKAGDKIGLINMPLPQKGVLPESRRFCKKEAEILGLIVGDGCISSGHFRFINKDEELLRYVEKLWGEIGGECTRRQICHSGFDGSDICHLWLYGRKDLTALKIYNEDGTKKIPVEILNADIAAKNAFLRGYNKADGLKAGCVSAFEYRNFKTNSATLASGLLMLIQHVTGQRFNITVEEKFEEGKRFLYYSINLLSNSRSGQNHAQALVLAEKIKDLLATNVSQREISRTTGASRIFIRKIAKGYEMNQEHHLVKKRDEVKKIIEYPEYDGWFYDLETESGTFHCGIGRAHVHNSPRRGSEFVTQKIAQTAAAIKQGYVSKLFLGNLEALRDWGHARDYVEAMWLMLQQDKPDDYVVATGKAHSVREFAEASFARLGLNYQDYVEVDPAFYRPTEVDHLLGNPAKALARLGWAPRTSFEELVAEMVDNAMEHPEEWLSELVGVAKGLKKA